VYLAGPVDRGWSPLVSRVLYLSEGSEERRLAAVVARQPELVVVWFNEGVETLYVFIEMTRASWLVALEQTRGISREAWREELAELAWGESESWRPGPRPRPHKRRNAPAPEPRVPFFATRSGAIPRTGRPELAGITLPAGARYPRRLSAYWASDETVADIDQVASRLAAAFATTGVWPLLWLADEDPDTYMGGHGDLDAIDALDALDAATLLTERWDKLDPHPAATEPFTTFPGLAPTSPPPTTPASPLTLTDQPASPPARLLLVPCNRPADAITALGGLACET
jgi:hypothetical protein